MNGTLTEQYRQNDGRFGVQPNTAPDVALGIDPHVARDFDVHVLSPEYRDILLKTNVHGIRVLADEARREHPDAVTAVFAHDYETNDLHLTRVLNADGEPVGVSWEVMISTTISDVNSPEDAALVGLSATESSEVYSLDLGGVPAPDYDEMAAETHVATLLEGRPDAAGTRALFREALRYGLDPKLAVQMTEHDIEQFAGAMQETARSLVNYMQVAHS